MITKEVNVLGRTYIGRQGENKALCISFEIPEELAECSYTLYVQRPKETTAYPAAYVTRDGNSILWTVSNVDTEIRGYGEVQIRFTSGETVIKTLVYPVQIGRSIDENPGEAPEWQDTWLDALTDLAEQTHTNAETAASAADDAVEAKEAAETAVSHYPLIIEGYWYEWSIYQNAFVNTGVKAEGEPGSPGHDGEGVPAGGSTGQVLTKKSGTDFDTEWQNPTGQVTSVNGKTGAVTLDATDVGAYSLPSGGVPKNDLASAVQTSLGKADTALQSFTETDPTVPSWAKAQSKPSYTASEVGAITLPANPSDGDTLVYDASEGKWVAGTPSASVDIEVVSELLLINSEVTNLVGSALVGTAIAG